MCGPLRTGVFFDEEFVGELARKADAGVRCTVITGPILPVEDAQPHPLLEFLETRARSFRLSQNLELYCWTNRYPALHYDVADRGAAMVEAFHSERDELRTVAIYDDPDVADALWFARPSPCEDGMVAIATREAYETIEETSAEPQFPLGFEPDRREEWIQLQVERLMGNYRRSSSDTTTNRAERDEFERQWEMFEANRDRIQQAARHAFVAVHNGEAFDSDDDRARLYHRVRQRHPELRSPVVASVHRRVLALNPLKHQF